MELYNWEQLPAEQMNAMVVRKVIHTGQMTIARLNILKDAVVPEHSHINEQVANVERGSYCSISAASIRWWARARAW